MILAIANIPLNHKISLDNWGSDLKIVKRLPPADIISEIIMYFFKSELFRQFPPNLTETYNACAKQHTQTTEPVHEKLKIISAKGKLNHPGKPTFVVKTKSVTERNIIIFPSALWW